MGNSNSRRNRRETQQRPGGGGPATGTAPAAGNNGGNNRRPPTTGGRQGQGGQGAHPGNQPYYLMFGGPPVHYRYNPGGPMIFYVDRQQSSAPPPEVSESETIRNLANLHKGSLSFEPHPDGHSKFTLTFTADTLTPTDVCVYFATTEKCDPDTPGQGGAMFVTQNPQLPHHAVNGGRLGVGSLLKFTCPIAFDVDRYAAHLSHSEATPGNYPIVVQLSYEQPKEQDDTIGPDDKGKGKEPVKNSIRRQYTYAQVVPSTDNGVTTYKIKPIRQRLQVDGSLYEVEDIYGGEGAGAGPGAVEGQVVEGNVEQVEVEGEECVICLANDRDTIVMPCRHLCLCGDCAEVLRKQTNKCPICRTVIERLITKKTHEQS